MSSAVLDQVPHIVSLFPSLSDISLEDWSAEGIAIVKFQPSHVIEEGHFLQHAVLLLEGTVRMFKISGSGREVTLYRIHSGECCPLMMASILGESEYEASACTEEPGVALAIPVYVFRDWMDRYKSFRQFIFKMFAKRLIIMSNLLDSINFKSIRGRIAEFIVQMTEDGATSLDMTHGTMSIELGTAREVISRTLKSLENEGLLRLSRGRIYQIKRQELKKYIEL
ncbi:Crp/Fnr family transcriptional regulator [Paenibacillus agricola]|uniref:Crp/Fnr family transcriptional regulator n=1 Tax=Paenibacillus agricola TaxID=2716264 RepID=A0ABX0JC14_9BACL|nr:Crp/Fnr family transcriptional regulator [Paenibacillus agricola]NHN31749.1 Crp/Fnr family transcriptional regulator [Paenibacillus agricola]